MTHHHPTRHTTDARHRRLHYVDHIGAASTLLALAMFTALAIHVDRTATTDHIPWTAVGIATLAIFLVSLGASAGMTLPSIRHSVRALNDTCRPCRDARHRRPLTPPRLLARVVDHGHRRAPIVSAVAYGAWLVLTLAALELAPNNHVAWYVTATALGYATVVTHGWYAKRLHLIHHHLCRHCPTPTPTPTTSEATDR